jgi:hypothetical protein
MNVETFVVQICVPTDDVEPGGGRLPGFVEHVGSGRRAAFRGAGELLAFLGSAATPTQTRTSERSAGGARDNGRRPAGG